ncbi:MAG: hypothetical protein AAF717_22795 [Bacteroidota bacterium]
MKRKTVRFEVKDYSEFTNDELFKEREEIEELLKALDNSPKLATHESLFEPQLQLYVLAEELRARSGMDRDAFNELCYGNNRMN